MRLLGWAAAVTLVLSGCGGPSVPATTAVDACGAAFAAAAGVDKNADTVADLYPAVRACATIAAWSAAFVANDGAGFTGSATEVLANVCTAPEVADTPLCKEAGGSASDLVENACAGTSYTGCVQSLTTAVSVFGGSTVAICEYSGGEGDIVTVDAGETPEDACSGGGTITPSTVHGTVAIPGN